MVQHYGLENAVMCAEPFDARSYLMQSQRNTVINSYLHVLYGSCLYVPIYVSHSDEI